MHPLHRSLISALCVFGISCAFGVTNQSGVTLGVNGGWASPDSKPSITNFSTTNKNVTLGATVGYNYALGQHISTGVEANYTDFGKTNYNGNSAVSNASGSFKNSAIQILMTGTYLMDNGFNTFLKVGAAHESSDLSLSNSSSSADVGSWLPAVAAGLGYKFIQNLNIYAEYERTIGSNWDDATTTNAPSSAASMNAFTMGVNYTLPM